MYKLTFFLKESKFVLGRGNVDLLFKIKCLVGSLYVLPYSYVQHIFTHNNNENGINERTLRTVDCLYRASLSLPFYHINDVFLTGLAARACGLRIHRDARLFECRLTLPLTCCRFFSALLCVVRHTSVKDYGHCKINL